jgi:hypothetical protein
MSPRRATKDRFTAVSLRARAGAKSNDWLVNCDPVICGALDEARDRAITWVGAAADWRRMTCVALEAGASCWRLRR